jgi:hypothetical protein
MNDSLEPKQELTEDEQQSLKTKLGQELPNLIPPGHSLSNEEAIHEIKCLASNLLTEVIGQERASLFQVLVKPNKDEGFFIDIVNKEGSVSSSNKN